MLRESAMMTIDNGFVDEERITNPESKELVKRRENFIGSHIYGEDIGGFGKMYVAYSYGEQYPAFLWYKDKWYHNTDDYFNPDGTKNEYTPIHMQDMRPTLDTHGLAGHHMTEMIKKFMHKYKVTDIEHTSVEPGERN